MVKSYYNHMGFLCLFLHDLILLSGRKLPKWILLSGRKLPKWPLLSTKISTTHIFLATCYSIMKRTTVAMLAAIIALSAVTVSLAMNNSEELNFYSLKSQTGILGHLTLTAYDEDGNVIAYRQTDNIVTNVGDGCISELIYTITSGAACTGGATTFDRIYIGTGSSNSATEGTTTLTTVSAQTGFDSAALTSALTTGGASTLITANFFNVGATIQEAAIQESSATTSSVLAIQAFAAIPLGASDDLTIQWTVTIDGN